MTFEAFRWAAEDFGRNSNQNSAVWPIRAAICRRRKRRKFLPTFELSWNACGPMRLQWGRCFPICVAIHRNFLRLEIEGVRCHLGAGPSFICAATDAGMLLKRY